MGSSSCTCRHMSTFSQNICPSLLIFLQTQPARAATPEAQEPCGASTYDIASCLQPPVTSPPGQLGPARLWPLPQPAQVAEGLDDHLTLGGGQSSQNLPCLPSTWFTKSQRPNPRVCVPGRPQPSQGSEQGGAPSKLHTAPKMHSQAGQEEQVRWDQGQE